MGPKSNVHNKKKSNNICVSHEISLATMVLDTLRENVEKYASQNTDAQFDWSQSVKVRNMLYPCKIDYWRIHNICTSIATRFRRQYLVTTVAKWKRCGKLRSKHKHDISRYVINIFAKNVTHSNASCYRSILGRRFFACIHLAAVV